MDEITLDDKTYVSSKRAAEITGYAKDYVGQLCREGRVEARLVGRNWYVLEASIREHRFGITPIVAAEEIQKETEPFLEEKQIETPEESVWKSPNYLPDTSPVLIPTLNIEEKSPEINVLDKYSEPQQPQQSQPAQVSIPESSEAVKEMQSAWHDWFARTNELEVSRETLLESPETEPVTLEKVSEVIEQRQQEPEEVSFGEEVSIPIHRALPIQPQPAPIRQPIQRPRVSSVEPMRRYVPTQAPAPVAVRMAPPPLMAPMPSTAPQTQPQLRREVSTARVAPQGRIIRERRVIKKKKPSIVLQAVLLSIAGIAIAVALIGSGELDSFLNHGNVNYMPVQYLGGENTVNNASK